MYKKNITFNDFDGNPVTEPFYFNLTQAEVVKLETRFLSKFGMGINDTLTFASEKRDLDLILSVLELLIGTAYGERVGNRFNKSPELTASFMASEAYSSLIFELIEKDGEDDTFFKAVLPDMKGLNERLSFLAKKNMPKKEPEALEAPKAE